MVSAFLTHESLPTTKKTKTTKAKTKTKTTKSKNKKNTKDSIEKKRTNFLIPRSSFAPIDGIFGHAKVAVLEVLAPSGAAKSDGAGAGGFRG